MDLNTHNYVFVSSACHNHILLHSKKKSTFLVDEKLTMTERSETGNWGACNCNCGFIFYEISCESKGYKI